MASCTATSLTTMASLCSLPSMSRCDCVDLCPSAALSAHAVMATLFPIANLFICRYEAFGLTVSWLLAWVLPFRT